MQSTIITLFASIVACVAVRCATICAHILKYYGMHSWIRSSYLTPKAAFGSVVRFSKTCWNKQWHLVPLTPTSVQVPFPSALWLPALYPDKYTAPGCPAGLWGNEIQMPEYLWYHCPKPLPLPVAIKQLLGHKRYNCRDKTRQYIEKKDSRHAAELGVRHDRLDCNSLI